MKTFTKTVADPNGLHARPAGKLAALAKRFAATVTVTANGKEADCKRLLSVMGLGAVYGTALRFTITGEDEETAYNALLEHCADWGDC